MVEKLLLILPIIALVAFIIMDILTNLFNKSRTAIENLYNTIAQKDAEIENLRVENANLTAQLAQFSGVTEQVNSYTNFLAEKGL